MSNRNAGLRIALVLALLVGCGDRQKRGFLATGAASLGGTIGYVSALGCAQDDRSPFCNRFVTSVAGLFAGAASLLVGAMLMDPVIDQAIRDASTDRALQNGDYSGVPEDAPDDSSSPSEESTEPEDRCHDECEVEDSASCRCCRIGPEGGCRM